MDRLARISRDQLSVAMQAAQRWQERAEVRTLGGQRYQLDGPAAADTPVRAAQFARRESLRRQLEARDAAEGFPIVKERVIGPTLDFTSYAPDEESRLAGCPVARIVDTPQRGVLPRGFGTGFLVAPRLLLTNHHVFPTYAEAKGTAANFSHEYTSAGLQLGPLFEIDPDGFYVSDETLDFALVAVQPISLDGVALDTFGFVRLIEATGKILVGHQINIIQYPAGGPKQYATTQNKLLDVLESGFIHYTTDTLQGSSGSPAYNTHWEVVALHHSAVPLVQNGKVIAKDGKPWNTSRPQDDILWVANEGIRVSGIVHHLSALKLDGNRAALLRELLKHTIDPLGSENREASMPVTSTLPVVTNRSDRTLAIASRRISADGSDDDMAQTVFNIQGPSTIYVGTPLAASPQPLTQRADGEVAAAVLAAGTVVEEKKLRFDQNYKRRKGYSPDFLEGFHIPLPSVGNQRLDELLRDEGGEPRVLKYHHFSLVMNKKRRLQMWSAVNVDYDPAKKSQQNRQAFGTDTWIEDPRINASTQIQDDDFYKPATKVDRGHIVQREDNAWGDSELEIEYANSDTFHWTNCTPQHAAFNQERRSGLWGQFEGYITQNIGAVGNRATLLAGPVLDNEHDPEHDYGLGSVQYPLRFWKVVAAVSGDRGRDELIVCGFMFDQTGPIERFGLERIDFAKYERYQLSLPQITRTTGVVFPKVLLDADTLRGAPAGDERIALESLDQIRLSRPAAKAVGRM